MSEEYFRTLALMQLDRLRFCTSEKIEFLNGLFLDAENKDQENIVLELIEGVKQFG